MDLHAHVSSKFSGKKKTAPHLAIPGVTITPQHAHADRPHGSLHLAVACCINGGNFIRELTGTVYPGYVASKQYLQPNGKPYQSMGSEEYADFLTSAMEFFKKRGGFRACSQHAMLIHDRFRVHMSKTAMKQCQKLDLRVQPLPPRSPDLQPLDYAVFGNAKRRLEKMVRNGDVQDNDWAARVRAFKKLIKETDIKPAIQQFRIRLNACVDSGGKHIEQTMKGVCREVGPHPFL
jgi:hypothetical protein